MMALYPWVRTFFGLFQMTENLNIYTRLKVQYVQVHIVINLNDF